MGVATSAEVPGLRNLSLVDLTLKKNGVLKPIWHPNAHKVGHCMQGKMHVSLHGPTTNECFIVEKGEMFYVPEGFVHHLENATDSDSRVTFALNHARPETMTLSQSLLATSDEALDSTFSTSTDFVAGLKEPPSPDLIGVQPEGKGLPESKVDHHRFHSGKNDNPIHQQLDPHRPQYKFNIQRSDHAIESKGGYLQVGLKVNLSVLQGVGILYIGVNPGGAVEPHWHPNSDELVYVIKGRIRGMLLSPDGSIETQEVGAGGGFYAPASYFHSIENAGDEEVEAIGFFDNPEMVYMGLGQAVGAFSDDILASAFNVSPDFFKGFNKPEAPLVIVPS